ncbi:hypothetical protein SAMN05519104_8104 [Rhizobiales bacterium GAS188]|nr:hypothetical protein SAMN05519104_8104 [Rhizobiales bacterium GAS188]
MQLNADGKSVRMEVDFWVEDDGSIHMTAMDVREFHVTISANSNRKNGHYPLYRRLADCLRKMGAPAPDGVGRVVRKCPPGRRPAVPTE